MSSNAPTASPKQVVKALMKFKGHEDPMNPKSKLIYKCPKLGCGKEMKFAPKSGFSNPYQHLRSCYARGMTRSKQESILQNLFREALQKQARSGGTILGHFSVQTLSELDSAMYSYIRLITMCNLPVSIVEDSIFRSVSRFEARLKRSSIVEVMFKLVELVEKRIAEELVSTIGAIMYDGWSSCSTHYVAAYALYMSSTSVVVNGTVQKSSIPRFTLLSVAPMGQINEEAMNCGAETSSFNAEAHLNFFEQVLKFYNLQFNKWCRCLIGDNASTNLRIAKISGIPHVGCASHKLHLEVNAMVSNHIDLKNTIDSVRETMSDARSKLKNAAILRNITDLRPKLDNDTRWSGKFEILKQFAKMRDDILEAAEHPDCDIKMNKSNAFANKTNRYVRMLKEINDVTRSLQSDGHTLADCRDDINALIEAVTDEKDDINSVFYGCRLGKKYIGVTAPIVKYPAFESGAYKLLKGFERDLTDEEKIALQGLKKESVEALEEVVATGPISMAERMAKRRKVGLFTDNYGNCLFILGSVARVERLWSIANYTLTTSRRRMTPQLLEAILFLRENQRFWDPALVAVAVGAAGSARAESLLNEQSSANMDIDE